MDAHDAVLLKGVAVQIVAKSVQDLQLAVEREQWRQARRLLWIVFVLQANHRAQRNPSLVPARVPDLWPGRRVVHEATESPLAELLASRV
jgi:hypothetical protein